MTNSSSLMFSLTWRYREIFTMARHCGVTLRQACLASGSNWSASDLGFTFQIKTMEKPKGGGHRTGRDTLPFSAF